MKSKRALEEQLVGLEKEYARICDERDSIRRIIEQKERVLRAYAHSEFKHVVITQSRRVVDAEDGLHARIYLDNGVSLVRRSYDESIEIFYYDDFVMSLRAAPSSRVLPGGDWSSFVSYQAALKHVADVYPEIVHLATEVLPPWFWASHHYDWESLMTTRVLHWIAKQLPGTMWPDILRDFVIKMV